jgi:hypothetical protein
MDGFLVISLRGRPNGRAVIMNLQNGIRMKVMFNFNLQKRRPINRSKASSRGCPKSAFWIKFSFKGCCK